MRGGIGVFTNNLSAGQIGSALDNTGLPSGTQQIVCTGPAAPIPNWAGYAASTNAVPDRCADGSTGTVFSNVVLAVAPDAIASKVFFITPNAGPAQYTGEQCNPFFFAASWPSEAYSEAAGQYVTSRGLKNVVFLAPNYQGGKDAATGFKR